MTVINTNDIKTDDSIIDLLVGWNVNVNGHDIKVTGSGRHEGFATIKGLPLDDKGEAIEGFAEVGFVFDDAEIEVF